MRRQKAIRPRARVWSRIAASASGRPSRRVPRPWAISGRPPPLARRSPASRPSTRSPAEMPRATRSSDTVTKSCGSSASSASAMTPEPSAPRTSRAAALSSSIESNGQRPRTASRTPGATSCAAAASSPGLGRPAAGPGLERAASSRAARPGAPRRGRRSTSTDCAPSGVGGPLEDVEALANERVRGGAGEGLDAAHARSRCSARR